MKRIRVAFMLAVLAMASAVAPSADAVGGGHFVGALDDGGTWVADVPAEWNGILILYSHGFGPPVAQNAPDGGTRDALLARGYALAGSSFDPAGSWWALQSAVRDQFETLDDVSAAALPHRPREVIALGTSMGGLVSSLEAQVGEGVIDGALSTCGLLAGANDLNNYQLAGIYTIARLIAPEEGIKLVGFTTQAEGAASGIALHLAAQEAQQTPEGRARLALAMAFLNAPPVVSGGPGPADPEAYQGAQFDGMFGPFPIMVFIQAARYSIEQSAGGNSSWTRGEDFAQLLRHSSYQPVVQALYRRAGLDLKADLAALTANADIAADPAAITSLLNTSVPTGHLDVPVLTMHTTADALVPVQHEREYAEYVKASGSASLLRQAYVDRVGHCAFTPAELVAGIEALRTRVETGRWGSQAAPSKLNEVALALDLGDARFVEYKPDRLSGDPGDFNPATNDTQ